MKSPGFQLLVLVLCSGCGSVVSEPLAAKRAAVVQGEGAGGLFVDVSRRAGVPASTEAWPRGTYTLPEITGGGVALGDLDNDGDLDIIQAVCPPPGEPHAPAPNRVYQQDGGRFTEVGQRIGLADPGYGQGIALGDVDNDGDLDVYFANFGPDSFYLNLGNGTFRDATDELGVRSDDWNTSATFADFDADGNLDLFVVGYTHFDASVACANSAGIADYCGPLNFRPSLDKLFRNRGDGTMVNVTESVGITNASKGLGVVGADVTNDGLVDFYVANDGEPNQLWVQIDGSRFIDDSTMLGVSTNGKGTPEGSMGIAIGDVNNDFSLDLYTTHIQGETNTLYMSEPMNLFSDQTNSVGLGMVDMPYTGFGCGFFDYDRDGDLDLAIVNGRVKRGPLDDEGHPGGFWEPYEECNLLLRNDGQGRFHNLQESAGEFATARRVSRGLAFGDIDNDGDVDLVVGNIGGHPEVHFNECPSDNHWLTVRVLEGQRDALGAKLEVQSCNKKSAHVVLAGYSYASSNDPRCHIGLGECDVVDCIDVTWVDGSIERFGVNQVDQQVILRKGHGELR